MSGIVQRAPVEDLPALAGGKPAFEASRRLIFQAPVITDAEIDAVTECLRSRWIGLGPRVTAFEEDFARYTGAPYAAAVSSCSAALHLALIAMNIGPGDEVIAATMTYCATVHAILHAGATPVLADCDLHSYNMTVADIERRITAKTRAVIVVHMAGRACDMDGIVALCRAKKLRLIEDCAHAIETTYHGVHAGLFGDVGCFSFYPTKNITTGDGGMAITRNARLHRRIKLLSQNGMSAGAWERETKLHRTRILAAGFKYNMTDIEAALGRIQLAAVESRWECRKRLCESYTKVLQHPAILLAGGAPEDSRNAYHLFSIRLRLDGTGATRDDVVAGMKAENIGTGIHYVPVHQQPYYRHRYRFKDSDFPNASQIGASTLSLPLSADLSFDELSTVSHALLRLLNYFYAKGQS